jgi:hypothetical protein
LGKDKAIAYVSEFRAHTMQLGPQKNYGLSNEINPQGNVFDPISLVDS